MCSRPRTKTETEEARDSNDKEDPKEGGNDEPGKGPGSVYHVVWSF